MEVIAFMGPTGGGKSTLAHTVADCLGRSCAVVSFADYLREVATEAGWDKNLKHTAEHRQLIQNTSAVWKEKYGEDIFAKTLFSRAKLAGSECIIIDDLRHSVEMTAIFVNATKRSIVCIDEPKAEKRWESAFVLHRSSSDGYGWATHRSELEWRGFRHLFPHVLNNKEARDGLELAVTNILTTIDKGEFNVR